MFTLWVSQLITYISKRLRCKFTQGKTYTLKRDRGVWGTITWDMIVCVIVHQNNLVVLMLWSVVHDGQRSSWTLWVLCRDTDPQAASWNALCVAAPVDLYWCTDECTVYKKALVGPQLHNHKLFFMRYFNSCMQTWQSSQHSSLFQCVLCTGDSFVWHVLPKLHNSGGKVCNSDKFTIMLEYWGTRYSTKYNTEQHKYI